MAFPGFGASVVGSEDPMGRIKLQQEELDRRIQRLGERDKRYHGEIFNDVRRDEAFLKNYSKRLMTIDERLITSYQDLARIQGKPIGKGMEEMIEFLGSREEQTFVIPPAVLDPLIRAYEAKHCFLENEVVTLQGDLKRAATTVELLLQDNNKLRSHLTKRDAETTQLLETIGMNDGETVLKLRKQITILEDEMRVLYSQLDMLKETKQAKHAVVERVEHENDELRKIMQKLRSDLEESKLKQSQGAEQGVMFKQLIADLQKKFDAESTERMRLETEAKKFREAISRAEMAKKEAERKLEIRESDSRKNEEMRLQDNSLQNNSISSLRGELAIKDREIKRFESLLRARGAAEGDTTTQLDIYKQKNNALMEENKDLKKRIREIMMTETDYQDSTVVLKKKISDLERTVARQQIVSGGGIGTDQTNAALLEKRYDDMKRFYEARLKDLEKEVIEYRELNNQLINRDY